MSSTPKNQQSATANSVASFTLTCQKNPSRRLARLKITTKALLLELPEAVDEDTENRYRRISAGLLQKCQELGIPGTLYGTFRGRYDSCVLKHQGTAYLNYFNRDLFKEDRDKFQAFVDGTTEEMRKQGHRFEGDSEIIQPGPQVVLA
jgi:hypothetical protein